MIWTNYVLSSSYWRIITFVIMLHNFSFAFSYNLSYFRAVRLKLLCQNSILTLFMVSTRNNNAYVIVWVDMYSRRIFVLKLIFQWFSSRVVIIVWENVGVQNFITPEPPSGGTLFKRVPQIQKMCISLSVMNRF